MPSRVLCCANNRAAVADVYSPIPQKKSIIKEWERKTLSDATSAEDESQTPLRMVQVVSLDKEQVEPEDSIFRTPSLISEDGDDLLSLKRANPVFDEEDDDEVELRMPVKRQRRSTTDSLHWRDLIVEDEEGGYQIVLESL